MDGDAAGSAGELLERDHRRIDEGFARFAESLTGRAVDRAAFHDAALALRHHIYIEEVHHFPAVKASGLMAPVLVMLREHGEIWDLLDSIAGALDRGDGDGDGAAAKAVWPELAEVLEQHNVKEEMIVYPAGDEQLSAEVAEAIVDELANGTTPEGWVCEMAGRKSPPHP